MPDPRYPIGPFEAPSSYDAAVRKRCLDDLAALPFAMARAVAGLNAAQLDTPYRPGGWTLRQVVHHVADSHVHAYARTKLAATEEEPTIKPYDEKSWAELADGKDGDVATSLALLECLHRRWVAFLRSLPERAFARTWRHPERDGVLTLDWLAAQYAWHGRHHTAHVASAREANGW